MGKYFISTFVLVCLLLFVSPTYAGYRTDVMRATKSGRIFNFETWDAKIIWHATFFNDGFRSVYDAEHIDINHLTPIEAELFLTQENLRQSRGWDFFVSFYTKKDYKNFTNSEDSFWKIRLIKEDGEEIKPDAIDEIPIKPYELAMYPHLNRWTKGYRVTFPKIDLGDKFKLSIMSVVGKSDLLWHVKWPRDKRDEK